MVNFSYLILPALLLAGADAWDWTACTNAPKCQQKGATKRDFFELNDIAAAVVEARTPRGGKGRGRFRKGASGAGEVIGAGSTAAGLVSQFSGGGGKSTRFSYQGKDHYWYSHDVKGLFVSPTGYTRFANGYNTVGVAPKGSGASYWSNGGGDCCLPDGVGNNINDVRGYN